MRRVGSRPRPTLQRTRNPPLNYLGPAVETYTGKSLEVMVIAWDEDGVALIQRKDGKAIRHNDATHATQYRRNGRYTYMFASCLLQLPDGPLDYSQIDEGGVV